MILRQRSHLANGHQLDEPDVPWTVQRQSREVDRLSASYLIALGARMVREVGALVRRANEAGKRLATLSVDAEISFRSAADRAAFSAELSEAIGKLVSKYHDDTTPGSRAHRLILVAHPLPQKSEPKELLQ